jgi:hypothetical protein
MQLSVNFVTAYMTAHRRMLLREESLVLERAHEFGPKYGYLEKVHHARTVFHRRLSGDC